MRLALTTIPPSNISVTQVEMRLNYHHENSLGLVVSFESETLSPGFHQHSNPNLDIRKSFKNYFKIIQKCIQKYPKPRCREADQFQFCVTSRQPDQTASLDSDHQHQQESRGDHDRTKATFVATD